MYAVIETGGKQYRVEVGTELEVETLDAEPGESITLGRVLLVADGDETSIGRPLVADAAVEAEVLRRDRADKVIVFKYRPKARRRVKKGHRQNQTVVRITDVRLGSKSAAEEVREQERDARSRREALEEAARRQAAADAALAEQLAEKSGGSPARGGSSRGGSTRARGGQATKGKGDATPAPKTTARSRSGARPSKPTTKASADKPAAGTAGSTKGAGDSAASTTKPDSIEPESDEGKDS
jgi:large subunit ribosomal protein L21